MYIVKVSPQNLHQHYTNPNANLYIETDEPGVYEIIDGFTEEECLQAIKNGKTILCYDGPAGFAATLNLKGLKGVLLP